MARIPVPAPWRGLLAAAAFILAGTAILHALAYPALTEALPDWEGGEQWRRAIEGLWLMFSIHLVVIAGFLITAVFKTRLASDSSLFVCALLLAADTGLLGGFMGLTFGPTLLVGTSAVLVIGSRTLRGAGPS